MCNWVLVIFIHVYSRYMYVVLYSLKVWTLIGKKKQILNCAAKIWLCAVPFPSMSHSRFLSPYLDKSPALGEVFHKNRSAYGLNCEEFLCICLPWYKRPMTFSSYSLLGEGKATTMPGLKTKPRPPKASALTTRL